MTDLVPAVPRCVRCAAPVVVITAAQLPLPMLHGGYGATTVTRTALCPNCGHRRTIATDTEAPPKRGKST